MNELQFAAARLEVIVRRVEKVGDRDHQLVGAVAIQVSNGRSGQDVRVDKHVRAARGGGGGEARCQL